MSSQSIFALLGESLLKIFPLALTSASIYNLPVFNRLFLLLGFFFLDLLFSEPFFLEELLFLEVLLEKQFDLLAQNGVIDLDPVNGSV
jgi:hypothetical protein